MVMEIAAVVDTAIQRLFRIHAVDTVTGLL
jgi:hypothetical protein